MIGTPFFWTVIVPAGLALAVVLGMVGATLVHGALCALGVITPHLEDDPEPASAQAAVAALEQPDRAPTTLHVTADRLDHTPRQVTR